MIYHPFKLPITYQENVFPLSESVINDLELVSIISKELFQPSHAIGNEMMKEWSKQITTDVSFLEETQLVLKDMKYFQDLNIKYIDTNAFITIWKDTKENDKFLEKYYYMDWEMLLHLNKSTPFLQILSATNICAPLISLVIPIIFLIFPLLILKIQNISINFDSYIMVLKDTARHHFIGKTILNMQNLSFDKAIYLIITFGLYFLQIYQNVNVCRHFYQNVKTINKNLLDIRDYMTSISSKMDLFNKLHHEKNTYNCFCEEIRNHSIVLKRFLNELNIITPFNINLSKFNDIGYMLKCYHDLKYNEQYDISIRFSYGFEGYIDNLMGVYKNIDSNNVTFATFNLDKDISIELKEQIYPPYKDLEQVVPNDVILDKNIIITGPNASGKTTLLKTTTINTIFSQQLGCGFYKKCILNPFSHIHSYLNIPDTSERDSLFQAESRRCKDILDIIDNSGPDSRHFCIFDELYSGTNPVEATKSSIAFLSYLSKYNNVNFLLTTHYHDICKKLRKNLLKKNRRQVRNLKMDVIEYENGNIKYTYKISKGISYVQGAIRIFEEMNYPSEIIESFKGSTYHATR
jgi:hypothetical protein